MTRAFLYVALAVGLCSLQATAIQADPVDSLPVQADEEEPDRINLPATALQVSTPGPAKLIDAGVSEALLRATGTHGDRPVRQVHHRGPGRGRPPKSTTTDSTQVDSGGVGAGTRMLKRVVLGSAMTVAATFLGAQQLRDYDSDGDPPGGLEIFTAFETYGIGFGWPIGVYLADPWESSLWMIAVGHGVAWRLGENTPGSGWGILGWTIMVAEVSRSVPKGIRNPNPFKWLFRKFHRPDTRVSFGLVPELRRGWSARATLRF